VPNDALLDAADGSDVATVLRVRDGRVQRTQVRLGLRGLAASEVLEGLQPGDQVVAAGALDPGELPEDGERVRIEGQPQPDAGDDAGSHGASPLPVSGSMSLASSIALRFLRQARGQPLPALFGIAVGVSVLVFRIALIS